MVKDSIERGHHNVTPYEDSIDGHKIEYTIKLLLSCQIAWSISSRNEPKVAWMLEKFGSDVRLSRNEDFYPGTLERVCLIIGTVTQIKNTLDWIFNVKNDDKSDEIRQMKILIPKTSMGYLMYNRGPNGLKTLCEREHVDIQLPEQPGGSGNNLLLREIWAIITGQKDAIIRTVVTMAKVITKDPFYNICRNVSYEDFNGYFKWKELKNNIANTFKTSRIPMNWPQQQQQQQQQPFIQQNYYHQQQPINPPLWEQQPLPLHHIHQQQQQVYHQEVHQQPSLQQCDNPVTTVENQHTEENNSNTTTLTQPVDGGNNEAIGKPIPSITTFWNKASDQWGNNSNHNRRTDNNNSNDVIIPGIN